MSSLIINYYFFYWQKILSSYWFGLALLKLKSSDKLLPITGMLLRNHNAAPLCFPKLQREKGLGLRCTAVEDFTQIKFL